MSHSVSQSFTFVVRPHVGEHLVNTVLLTAIPMDWLSKATEIRIVKVTERILRWN
jgi:hypothetical protein